METETVEDITCTEGVVQRNRVGEGDMQVHGQHTVGAGGGCQGHSAVTSSVEDDVVPSYRQFSLADSAINRVRYIVIDCQDKSDSGVTVMGSGNNLGVCASMVIFVSIQTIGQFIFVNSIINCCVC